jgi:hypothetical protein
VYTQLTVYVLQLFINRTFFPVASHLVYICPGIVYATGVFGFYFFIVIVNIKMSLFCIQACFLLWGIMYLLSSYSGFRYATSNGRGIFRWRVLVFFALRSFFLTSKTVTLTLGCAHIDYYYTVLGNCKMELITRYIMFSGKSSPSHHWKKNWITII